ncbi:hypothetical protein [Paractinoplanes durhamensis]|uniref:NADH dehydrogenase subunit 2 n=1 Tax=Paractinoplanes durhamensis TaxID=113563 RepID=A0ABQ3Z7E7_9ACTN|nr:hypothetical protein [Actinoplanes durhamensis]GIE05752.1 hypothetical protein Adu01nite_71020 [Actinoplanes durhamensis]
MVLAVRRPYHPLVLPAALVFFAVPAAYLAASGRAGPFLAWVLMGVAAGYSISGSI